MKIFIFDVDDTFYSQIQPFEKALRSTCPEIVNRLETQMQEVFVRSRYYSDEVFERSRLGLMSMNDMYIYRIQSALRDFGEAISDEKALEYQKAYQANQYHLELSETMEHILENCNRHCKGAACCEHGKSDEFSTSSKSGGSVKINETIENCQLGILSNGPAEHQWKKIESLGVLKWIDRSKVVISGDVGVAKPRIEIFRLTEKKFPDCTPDEFYMIGDSFHNDIAGAVSAGWKTIWFNHRRRKNLTEISPDYEVQSEKELGDLLEKLLNAP